ncbi:cysteine-rich DPF motif domain-containing protein 1-like [Dreissena polymorpha]|uniref:cysteine-rich DPF motif domain-containing protein 1-like n=1 Tax=Dreissena polymorpha TaxID=45954 RepID=UPI0022645590|nr:cysteine-rich DPF motif domain-containing protein 1-like [Dreissena polymorpha]
MELTKMQNNNNNMETDSEKPDVIKEFLCSNCGLKVKYDYFGTKPPFAKSLLLMEDTFVMKDPFSSEVGIITLGSHCSLCQKSVCASQDCSIFYTKRFCMKCVHDNIEEFPNEIYQELKNRKLKGKT